MKVVVTDYIEPDLNWEAEEMARRGVEFATHQLKFAPEAEVIAATATPTWWWSTWCRSPRR